MNVQPPIAYNAYLMVEKLIIFTGLFSTVSFLVWMTFRHFRSRTELLRLHLSGRERLITLADSLGTLLAFARTPEGRSLLELPALGPARVPAGLRLLQAGVVCLSIAVLKAVLTLLLARCTGACVASTTFVPDGLSQAGLYAGAGLGLLLSGWLGRRAQMNLPEE